MSTHQSAPGSPRAHGSAAAGVGGACPDEEEILEFYRGTMTRARAEAIREHLSRCAGCLEVASDARAFLAAMGEATVRPGAALPLGRLAAAAAAILAVGGLLWWSAVGGLDRDPWRDVEIARAPYPLLLESEDELVWRGDERERSGTFDAAMERYAAGDDREAERLLAAHLLAAPDDAEGWLYRGVSQLLLGRSAEAVTSLEAAVARGEPPVATEARWYLALALLRTGGEPAAAPHLQVLAAAGGAHAPAARELLDDIARGPARLPVR